MLFLNIFTAIVGANVPSYGSCDKNNFKYKDLIGKGFALVPVLAASPIKVSGEVYFIDGCTFGVRNFVFYNARTSRFYGGNKGTAEGINLSETVVSSSANPSAQIFSLVKSPGAQTNFNSMNEIRLFEVDTNTLLAVATITATSGGSIGRGDSSAFGLNSEQLFGVVSALLLAFLI
jgi:hypothetical protein